MRHGHHRERRQGRNRPAREDRYERRPAVGAVLAGRLARRPDRVRDELRLQQRQQLPHQRRRPRDRVRPRVPEGSGRRHRQGAQRNRDQRPGRQLAHTGWRLSLPDLRECRETGGLCHSAGRLSQGDCRRKDSVQQPTGSGGILMRRQRGALRRPRCPASHGNERAMPERFFSRGFRGRRQSGATSRRLPPGQYETRDFPVLSAGPTPRTSLATWDFTIRRPGGTAARWTWDEFQALPHETVTTDIHCVTKWSKFDTVWQGVSVDTLLEEAFQRGVETAPYVLAVSDGGYTTNLPLADVTGGKAWVAVRSDGSPLAPEHGGPARLLVPHLYFWKSAKWVRQLRLMERDEAGFWESLGYHNYGDPWREQRYGGDP